MFGAALIGIAKEQHYSAKLSTAKEKRGSARRSNGEVERRTVKNCIGQAEFCFGTRRTAEALRGDAYLGSAMEKWRLA